MIWAATGKPVLAYETVVGGLQNDGTPNELHVITDAATGKKLYEYQAIETGTGNEPVQRHGHPRHHQVGLDVPADRRRARRPQDVQPQAHGTSGTGTLFYGRRRRLGQRQPANPQTAAVDAALRRRADLGLLQERPRPQRHQERRQGAPTPASTTATLRQRLLGRQPASA